MNNLVSYSVYYVHHYHIHPYVMNASHTILHTLLGVVMVMIEW